MASALLVCAYSCTDEWDSHYAENHLGNGNGTLWDIISNNPDLSNFRDVVAATGYDASLNNSQVFTVFAPTNAALSAADRDALISQFNADSRKGEKNGVIKEFIQNHIALYNHSLSSTMPDTTLYMMNGKRVPLTRSSFSGQRCIDGNILADNGILYTIDGVADYKPNIYEHIQKDAELSQVWEYLKRTHVEEFVPEKSVPGEIVNGKTEYLDSVTEINNKELRQVLRALLDSEDSVYWAVLPTNDVWDALVQKYEPCFQYSKLLDKIQANEEMTLRDSLVLCNSRRAILEGLQFSLTRNKKLGKTQDIDSVMSTKAVDYKDRMSQYGSYGLKYYQYDNPYDGIFKGTETVECSNGNILKAREWNVNPLTTFIKTKIIEAENSNNIDSLLGERLKPIVTYFTPSNEILANVISGGSYIRLTPTAENPGALFRLPNLLSNVPYDIYVVTVPDLDNETILPTKFDCNLVYYDVDSEKEIKVAITDKEISGVKAANDNDYNPEEMTFMVPADAILPIKLGTFTFPTCTYGLDVKDRKYPHAKLELQVSTMAMEVRKKLFTDNICIDCILVIPHIEQ